MTEPNDIWTGRRRPSLFAVAALVVVAALNAAFVVFLTGSVQ